MRSQRNGSESLAIDLRRIVEGDVVKSGSTVDAYASDYGQIYHRTPAVVIRPRHTADVQKVVRFAARHGIPVAARGTGHSTGSQGLNEGGIVLDMGSLNRIHRVHIEERWFEADAGTLWARVLDTTSPMGLTPPVLTGYPHVSLGGTLSAAGWGPASFHRGAQIDNCQVLEVVTGEGDLIRCSPEHNGELYHHVLGGLGQFGVITRVRHRLRAHQPVIRTYSVAYNSLNELLQAGDRLIALRAVDYIEGLIVRREEAGSRPYWCYSFDISVEGDGPDTMPDAAVLGTSAGTCTEVRDRTTISFVRDVPREVTLPGITHPWLVSFLPRSTAGQFIEFCLKHLPIGVLGGSRAILRLWPAHRHSTTMPMIRIPDEESIVAFAIFPTVPARAQTAALALLGRASDLAMRLGGKRYIATWTPFDRARWRMHFGEKWPHINALKNRYDPHRILNPSFIDFEDPITADCDFRDDPQNHTLRGGRP